MRVEAPPGYSAAQIPPVTVKNAWLATVRPPPLLCHAGLLPKYDAEGLFLGGGMYINGAQFTLVLPEGLRPIFEEEGLSVCRYRLYACPETKSA